MKQTAVNYLIKELFSVHDENFDFNQVFIKALEMEKEEIIEAYNEGQNTPYEYSESNDVNWYDGNNYYKETYNS